MDDIEKIIKIMDIKGDGAVKIFKDSHQYSLEELKQINIKNKIKFKELHFINESPYISLDLKRGGMLDGGKGGGRICASDEAEYRFLNLKDLLLKKKPWFSFLSSYVISFGGAIAIVLLIEHIIWNIDKSDLSFYLFVLLIIILFILILAPFAFDIGYFTSIDLNYSFDKESFWEKHIFVEHKNLIKTYGQILDIINVAIIIGIIICLVIGFIVWLIFIHWAIWLWNG